MEHSTLCIACESRLLHTLHHKSHSIRICHSCGTIQTSQTTISNHFGNSTPKEVLYQLALPLVSDITRYERYHTFSHYIKSLRNLLPSGKHILEIGSNIGIFARMCTSAGWHHIGVEHNPILRDLSTRMNGANVIGSTVHDVNPSTAFDCVFSADVFDYIIDPSAELNALRQFSGSNKQYFVCRLPNSNTTYFLYRCFRLLGSKTILGSPVQPLRPYRYSPTGFKALLTRHGFTNIRFFNAPYIPRNYSKTDFGISLLVRYPFYLRFRHIFGYLAYILLSSIDRLLPSRFMISQGFLIVAEF